MKISLNGDLHMSYVQCGKDGGTGEDDLKGSAGSGRVRVFACRSAVSGDEIYKFGNRRLRP